MHIDTKRTGDSWLFTVPDLMIYFTIAISKEDEQGLYGEVQVGTKQSGTYRHLARTRINLLLGRPKQDLAHLLSRKCVLESSDSWDHLVEHCSEIVVSEYRNSDPLIALDQVPQNRLSDDHLVTGILPRGAPTVIFSPGGSGKSMLALGLGVSVATFTPLLESLIPLCQENVLYLDWETQDTDQARRHRRICAGLRASTENVFYRSFYRPFKDDIVRIRSDIEKYKIGFLIIDSLAPACGGNPEYASDVMAFFGALRSCGEVTKLVLAHMSKSGSQQTSGKATVYGSIFSENFARSTWELRTSQEGTDKEICLALFHRKVNDGRLQDPIGIRLSFESDEIIFAPYDIAADPELAEFAGPAFRIRSLLKTRSLPAPTIAEQLGLELKVVLGTLRRMSDVAIKENLQGPGGPPVWSLRTQRTARFTE